MQARGPLMIEHRLIERISDVVKKPQRVVFLCDRLLKNP